MKKVFAIIFLTILIVFPVIAGGSGETIAAGAATGAGIGALFGGVGAIFGAVIGSIVGIVGGELKTQAEEKKEEAQNQSVIDELRDVTVPQTQAEISAGYQALARWQSTYDSSLAKAEDEAQSNLNILKSNWGMYNASLASLNREGATARLLSQEQKDKVITYAGEDMELNSEAAIEAASSVYNDKKNFDQYGNLTKKGAKKLELIGSEYGVYEKDLFNLSADLLSQKGATEVTIGLNEKALKNSKQTINKLEKRNSVIQQRRW